MTISHPKDEKLRPACLNYIARIYRPLAVHRVYNRVAKNEVIMSTRNLIWQRLRRPIPDTF